MSPRQLSKQIQCLFTQACVMDMLAVKPGNVSCHSAGHNMTSYDFLLSATVCAPPLCAMGGTLGERILNTIIARRSEVKVNTNLGIVLLCAPLAQAILAAPATQNIDMPLRQRLEKVLEQTTVDDARRAYEAICMADAGGLGKVNKQDVTRAPTVSLREAMALAADRDAIANEYANGYAVLFDVALPRYLELQRQWGYTLSTATGLYLFLLAKYPDSLVIRKRGKKDAGDLSEDIRPFVDKYLNCNSPNSLNGELTRLDAQFKERGINPGTTADMTVACLFLAELLARETEVCSSHP